jgi:Domain of unknown function (DUF4412)
MKNVVILVVFLLFFSNISFAQSAKNVKTEYNFKASMKYEMTSSSRKTKMNFKYLLPASAVDEVIGIEMNDDKKMNIRSVFDMKNKTMLMIMEEQKMAMAMPMDLAKLSSEATSDPKYKPSTPSKTGRTKTILGYNCVEWTMESDETKSSLWIANINDLPTKGLMEMMQNSMYKSAKVAIPSGMNGFPLEMDFVSKKNNEPMIMLCVEIKPNTPSTISTSGYKVMSIGAH